MAKTNLSVYDGVLDTKGVHATLDTVLKRIKTGERGLDEKTKLLNVLAQTDTEAYTTEKLKLPAVTWSGLFPKKKDHRTGKHLLQHSGLIVLDIDNDIDIGTALADFAINPHVFFAFVSPSSTGVKPVIPVDPIPTNLKEHICAFNAVLEAFSEYAEQDPEKLPKQRDVNRLCFLAHDPQALHNPNALPVNWEIDPEAEELPLTAPTTPITATEAAEIEAFIQKHNIVFGSDGKSQYFPKSFCQATQHKSNNNAIQFFRNDDGSVNGFCNGCQAHWWVYKRTRTRRKQVKLHKRTDLDSILEPLNKTRQVIAKAFAEGKRLLGLRADTGVGKTEEAKTFFLKGLGGWFSTPTTDLSKEVFDRFYNAGIDAFRWRGVASEPDGEFPHEMPCMFPDEYIAYAESGRNAYRLLCERCQYRDACEQHGYRSQAETSKASQVTVAAHKDLLMNPNFRTTAKRVLPTHKDDLIVIDEFDVFTSFVEINVTQKRLEYLRDTWHDHLLGAIAKRFLQLCFVEGTPYKICDDVLALNDDESYEVIQALSSLRIGDTILDSDAAHDYEAELPAPRLDEIKALPRIEAEDWNLLIQLKLFADTYRHAETAPIRFKDNTLTFYLPPLPLYTKARVLCMSATLNETFFRLVFKARQEKRGDVDFIDAADTQWHPEAKVFQLRTNRNPRRTLLVGDKDEKGKWRYTGELSDTGKKYLQRITQGVKAQPEKTHGFIAHKAIVENHTEELQALGVICGHFGNLVGLDARFKRDSGGLDVLHILGSPEVPQWTTEEHTKLLFGMTDAPVDFTRNDDGTFQDANVQAVYDAGVKSELMQGFGRAGLVLHPTTVVLWTAHDLPSVTHRNQTRLFDENDWDHADGNLDALPKAIAQRDAREAVEAEAIQDGDVKATAEAKGITEQHARRLTKDTRDAKREAEQQRVFELHQQGMSHRAIERDTGFSRRKITKLLNEYKAVQNEHGHIELLNADVRFAPPEKSVVNPPLDPIAGLLHFYIPEGRSIELSEIPPNEIQG